MCGIAGVVALDAGARPGSSAVVRMTESLHHRGPDDGAIADLGQAVFGHRRLSIIDVGSGQQPMTSISGRFTISYNGELYNYVELRGELVGLGYRFQTTSDTEVILNAYEAWGEACLNKFNGMWAFALWDGERHQLFCARDRLGEKPFYYAVHSGCFYFGSEIKALFAAGVPRVFNEEVLDTLLCLTYLPAPYTAFTGIQKLAPGQSLTLRNGRVRTDKYWDFPLPRADTSISNEHAALEAFSELFEDSVRLRMRSDVPLGAFLSGGLDSGSIVATMAGISREPIKTFTIGFSPDGDDERALARLVARQYRTDHLERFVGVQDAEGLLETLAWHFDEPFGDSSTVPTYIVSRLAREQVTVVLTGDGGDEVLWGYPHHLSEKLTGWWQRLPTLPRRLLLRGIRAALATNVERSAGVARLDSLMCALDQPFMARLEGKQVGLDSGIRESLLGGNRRVRPVRDVIEELVPAELEADPRAALSHWYHTVALPERYLCKVDRCSMANSLEARVPFLDHRLVELMARVAPVIKLPGFTRKHVLRKTAASGLPPQLLRASKKGFDPPMAGWSDQQAFWNECRRELGATGLFTQRGIDGLADARDRSRCPPMGLWLLGMMAVQERGRIPGSPSGALSCAG
ncbi:MAG: asparagine synthase (glutamine-hydrolyzing) [Pseudomonadales bacterium]